MSVELKLVVLRSADLARAEEFYQALGLKFQRERHGTGPEHLAAELGAAVFEIYPINTQAATSSTRLGIRVSSIAQALAAIERSGGKIATPATESPWGLRAVVVDPDGHRIELTE